MITDTAMVSRLGLDAMAGAGLGGILHFTVLAFIMGGSIGLQIVTARRFGEHGEDAVRKVFQTGIFLALCVGGLLSVAGFVFAKGLIRMFTPSALLAENAGIFLAWRMSGTILYFTVFMLRAFLDGLGRTMAGMYASFAITGFNILLNWILIFGNLGFPAMGIAGSGIASTLAAIPGILVFVIYIFFERSSLLRYIRPYRILPDMSVLRELSKVGFAPALEGTITNLSFVFFIIIAERISTLAVASSYALINVLSLSFMPGFAFSIAATTILGQAMGAKKFRLGHFATFRAASFSAVIMGCMGIFFIICGRWIIKIFTDSPEVVTDAYPALVIISLIQVGDAYHMVVGSALRSAGLVYWVMAAYSFLSFALMLPFAYFMGVVMKLGTAGLWSAIFVWILALSLTFVWKFLKGDWKKGVV